jgi:hypothetical protein
MRELRDDFDDDMQVFTAILGWTDVVSLTLMLTVLVLLFWWWLW